jgi:hypothetical protein
MQTWLVHTRHPQQLVREFGFIGSLGFGLVSTGLIVSSMVYPIYLVALLVTLADPMALWGDGGVIDSMVLGLNLFNLVGGYMAMALLAERALTLRDRRAAIRGIMVLPAYWLLMSLATYRALIDLALRPHHWEKTPHRRHVDGGRSSVAPAPRMNPVAASRGSSDG